MAMHDHLSDLAANVRAGKVRPPAGHAWRRGLSAPPAASLTSPRPRSLSLPLPDQVDMKQFIVTKGLNKHPKDYPDNKVRLLLMGEKPPALTPFSATTTPLSPPHRARRT